MSLNLYCCVGCLCSYNACMIDPPHSRKWCTTIGTLYQGRYRRSCQTSCESRFACMRIVIMRSPYTVYSKVLNNMNIHEELYVTSRMIVWEMKNLVWDGVARRGASVETLPKRASTRICHNQAACNSQLSAQFLLNIHIIFSLQSGPVATAMHCPHIVCFREKPGW